MTMVQINHGAAGSWLLVCLACIFGHLLNAPVAAAAADRSLNVLVKLSERQCNPTTGLATATALQNAIAQATAHGLQYLHPVGARCWYAFRQARSRNQTNAALQALGSHNVGPVSSPQTVPFVLALVDKPLLLPEPWLASPVVIRPDSLAPSDPLNTGFAFALPTVETIPEECAGGVCSQMWGMNRINAVPLWTQSSMLPTPFSQKGSVIDTGVDYAHSDLQGQVDQNNSRTFNRVGDSPAQGATNTNLSSASTTGHGSHVTGIIAGAWGNGDARGIAGAAGFAQESVVSCNAFSPGSAFSPTMTSVGAAIQDLVSCLNYVATVKAHWVINLSLAYFDVLADNQLLVDAVQQNVCDNDGIAVTAAGNSAADINAAGTDIYGNSYDGMYPAALAKILPDCVLAVAAIDSNDKLADFSNWGQYVTIAAPGVSVTSDQATRYSDSPTANLWNSATWSGTSMAAPHVTGVLLLLRNAFPTATAAQVLRCLRATATGKVQQAAADRSGQRRIGGGIMDASAAYDCLKAQDASNKTGASSPTTPPPNPGLINSGSAQNSSTPPMDPCATAGLPGCVNPSSGGVVPASGPRSSCMATAATLLLSVALFGTTKHMPSDP